MNLIAAASLFAAVDASEGHFDYVNYDSWGDLCVNGIIEGQVQQSPINIPSDADVSETVDLKFTSLFRGDLHLHQHLDEHDGQLSMHLKDEAELPMAEIEVYGKHYSLAGIHSHWGACEHFYDDAHANGNFHLVFASDEGDLSVIEVKVDFQSEKGDGVIEDFPRCENVSSELIDAAYTGLSCQAPHLSDKESVEDSVNQEHDILSVFGLTPELLNGRITHYVGSLTTPPCTTGVNWFVINQAVHVHDPTSDFIGCNTFRNAFPHQVKAGACVPGGNYRELQRVQESTKFYGVAVSYDEEAGATTTEEPDYATALIVPTLMTLASFFF